MIVNEMLKTALSTLLVAGISGVTFMAYKHPRGYAKMHPFLIWGAVLVNLVGNLWNLDLVLSLHRMYPFIPLDKFPAARAFVEEQTIPFFWLLVGCLGVICYAAFLRYFLPDMLKEENAPRFRSRKKPNPPAAN
ncbi:MAG: hypothetical protein ABSD76_00510 [Terriglobales bacterium]|jgi:hypothetical protein